MPPGTDLQGDLGGLEVPLQALQDVLQQPDDGGLLRVAGAHQGRPQLAQGLPVPHRQEVTLLLAQHHKQGTLKKGHRVKVGTLSGTRHAIGPARTDRSDETNGMLNA